MKRLLLMIAAMCMLSLHTNATNVSGGIYTSTTWTLANSPYIVTANLVVFDNATLTIEPGVQVLADSNVLIEVKGKLRVNGAAGNEVVIKGNTSSNNTRFWQGITFKGTVPANDSEAIVAYCRFSNAETATSVTASALALFSNCTFTYNKIAGSQLNGLAWYNYCTFKHGATALVMPVKEVAYCVFDSNAIGVDGGNEIINSKFTNHSAYAIGKVGNIRNCEIKNNNIAIVAELYVATYGIVDNIITNNDTAVLINSCYGNQNKLNRNKICSNTRNVVLASSQNCELPDNCWCSTDSVVIRGKIYDGYNNISVGLVSYMPLDSTCVTTSVQGVIAANENGLRVYPNPNKGTFVIDVPANIQSGEAVVMNVSGQVVAKQPYKQGNALKFDLQNAASGVYVLKLVSPSATSQTMFVVQ